MRFDSFCLAGNPQRRSLAWVACLMLLAALVCATVATASDSADVAVEQEPAKTDCYCEPRPQDQIWLVSTRHLGCPDEKSAVDLEFDFYDDATGWRDSDIETFLADEEANRQNTVFFIHGYQSDWNDAIDDGLEVYYALTCDCPDAAPIRFVIWSWPSEKSGCLLRDVKKKGFRTHVDGYYVGWLLAEIDTRVAQPAIRLIGHSYGGRVALGGLHVWGGGRSAGVALPPDVAATETQATAVFLAAAEHNWWILPHGRHSEAYRRIESGLNLYNSCDSALQRYRVVEKHARPKALGYTGLVCVDELPDGGAKIEEWDVCCTIGKRHSVYSYLGSNSLMSDVRRYIWASVGWTPTSVQEESDDAVQPTRIAPVSNAAQDEPGQETGQRREQSQVSD